MTPSPRRAFEESEAELHERATQITGLDDFGSDSYLNGLRVLLRAYDEEPRFKAHGGEVARQMVLGNLVKRLRSEKWLRKRPEVLKTEIERPLVICGLVRTGSTALHYLMGQDPDVQPLPYWLGNQPQPRPPKEEWEAHPDFQQARTEIDAIYQADPSIRAVHFMMPDGPEECRQLMVQEFTDDGFEVNNHVPSYSEWYEKADMLPTYRRHRDLIKLIGSGHSTLPWLLKYPVHIRFLKDFLQVYPDAQLIQTHRDPLSVLPSYLSLIVKFRSMVEDDVDPGVIARRQVELWARGVERAIEERKEIPSEQIYDLHFSDFMSDPIEAVQRIYSHFGRSLSEPGLARLRAWQEDNPQHRHGRHDYSRDAQEIGITEGEIVERFQAYMDHFGMESERRG